LHHCSDAEPSPAMPLPILQYSPCSRGVSLFDGFIRWQRFIPRVAEAECVADQQMIRL
jgi:hypothetical protein